MNSRDSLMRLTPDVVVDRLLQGTGTNPERYSIEWLCDSGDYKTKVDGVSIAICESISHIGIGSSNKIYLAISWGGITRTIEEPDMHISQTPLGKFLRFLTFLSMFLTSLGAVLLGIGPFPKELYPRGPQTPKEVEDEKVRVGLNQLYSRVETQLILRARKDREEYLRLKKVK